MTQQELRANWVGLVGEHIVPWLRQQPLVDVLCLNWLEALVRPLLTELGEGVYRGWALLVRELAVELAGLCPGCGKRRKCKSRSGEPMLIQVLGIDFKLPKLYLECGRCGTPGISVTKLLTGLRNQQASTELKLAAAYCGSQHSYGEASRDLEVHHGQEIERTSVRKMALEIEALAVEFAEDGRHEAITPLEQERRRAGVPALMLQGDGGIVRTGKLEPCEPGDPGYDQTTPKTGRPKRKRVTQFREVITLDVRQPGEMEPSALDVVVPVAADEGQREKRMLALAARKRLGDNTEVIGLGDMGSCLATAFAEAFVGHRAHWHADWKHTRDYVRKAGHVLIGIDVDTWTRAMTDALWKRDRPSADALIGQAKAHRIAQLPKSLERCPVHALDTYVSNNWDHIRPAELKERGLDYLSARADAQVRDRTKARTDGPGAWREENLEGKATLRAIIADGRWPTFREYVHQRSRSAFQQTLLERRESAIKAKRVAPPTTSSDLLSRTGCDQAANGHAPDLAAA